MEGKLTELLKQEDVDILPYMDWQITQVKTLDGQWVDMERLVRLLQVNRNVTS